MCQALCYGEHDSKQRRWLSGLSASLPCLGKSSRLEDSESKVVPMMHKQYVSRSPVIFQASCLENPLEEYFTLFFK